MRPLSIVLLVACGSSAAPTPSRCPCPAPQQPIVQVPAPTPAALRATAVVCVHCTGVSAVDADGRGHVTIYLTIDARVATTGLRLATVELMDDNNTIVARGAPPEYVGMVSEPPNRDLGKFEGRLAADGHVALWTGSRLDAQDATLWKSPPKRYRLRLVADGGVELVVSGAMMEPGSTG